mmetsp:Transcript_14395/g.26939  ORF Transcript_14395/g.26939 Transcript_14395/m.26939 type:complete len:82 (-) Transcript_14395:61-306(-)
MLQRPPAPARPAVEVELPRSYSSSPLGGSIRDNSKDARTRLTLVCPAPLLDKRRQPEVEKQGVGAKERNGEGGESSVTREL